MDLRHISIRLKDGKLYLTDLDTSTGTLVNGKEITRVELQDGDEIKVGSTTLKFRKL
jgi:pSer/pThr/pTyr-binding forkhead associated (FHA) protein